MNFAERFRQALKNADSIRAFHEEISDASKWGKVPGSSYSKIYRYLKGTDAPPLEFVEKAAEILGVRAAWLRSGEGEETEEKEAARRAGERVTEGRSEEDEEDEALERVEVRINEIFPLYAEFPPFVQAMIWSTVGIVADELVHRRGPVDYEKVDRDWAFVQATDIVAKSLYTPISLVPPSLIDPDRFALYGVAICEALMHAVSPFPAQERASRLSTGIAPAE